MPYFLNMHLLTFIFNPTLNSFPDRLLLDGVSRILIIIGKTKSAILKNEKYNFREFSNPRNFAV